MAENQTTGTTATPKPTDKWICEPCQGHGVRFDPTSSDGIGTCPYCIGRGEIY